LLDAKDAIVGSITLDELGSPGADACNGAKGKPANMAVQKLLLVLRNIANSISFLLHFDMAGIYEPFNFTHGEALP
jgi:hypothetical protein